ncbi:hypothetical protein O181_019885 [Austropuccinia psidii MF-1]|uniref:Amine oxidase domain-containing protein n=1 Tax=Austropuccinia psidii MF-1 TaxID=1389203 RepID=A0A9Q3CBK9_9BASI|nr:hypothetical protein [Austropuccinia psidii MF-1]
MAAVNQRNKSFNSKNNLAPIDVLIIGAGMAGLAAGLQLVRAGHPVTIVEARDRVGGRISSHNWTTGSIDIGASFLHGVDGNPLINLLKEYEQPIYFENKEDSIKIYSSHGQSLSDQVSKSLYEHANDTFFSTARTYSQTNLFPSRLPPSLATSDNFIPYNLNLKKPLKSLHDFLLEPSNSPLFKTHPASQRMILEEIINSLDSWTGASSEKVSLKWWGFERDFTGEDAVLPKTYHALIRKMASEFECLGGKILLKSECERIRFQTSTARIRVRLLGQPNELEASCCVCTLPLGVLQAEAHRLFDPPLPPRRLLAISRTGFGLLNKVIVRYDHAWWPSTTRWFILLPNKANSDTGSESDQGRSPTTSATNSTSTEEEDWPSPVPARRFSHPGSNHEQTREDNVDNQNENHQKLFAKGIKVQNYFQITGEPILVFYLGGEAGEIVEKLDDKLICELTHQKLLSNLPLGDRTFQQPQPPIECVVTRWKEDKYSRGSYSFMKTDHSSEYEDRDSNPIDLIEMSRPLWNGKLGFAGEHCSLDHYACVHGPYITGIEEANRIKANYHQF